VISPSSMSSTSPASEPPTRSGPVGSSPAVPHRARLALIPAIGGAFVVTLLRPASWAVGLAGFLAGGGILIVTLPVAVLPTPSGIQNGLGGPVSTFVVGTPSSALIALIALVLLAVIVAIVVGVVIGAWAERAGIWLALGAADEEGLLVAPDLEGAPGVGRVAVVRALSLVPVTLAAALAWPSLYDAAYRELTLPGDLATPLPVRILRAVPVQLAAVVVTWLLSDAAASLGVRRLILGRRPALAAWLLGWLALVRRPVRALVAGVVGVGTLVLLLGPALLAATVGWDRVRDLLLGGSDAVAAATSVAIWVAIWLGALVLAGLGAAVRVALWTLVADLEP
jgi:hypothetical protein